MQTHPPRDLLTQFPALKRLFRSRAFQPAFMLLTLAVFALAVLTGFFGTPAGNRNFGIVFVWIVWWALLIILLVPALGRFWCTICPIPAPGEWVQRRAIIRRVPGLPRTLGWRWPRRLKNMWLQNFGFLGVALFSAVILTRPAVSASVLLAFVVAGLALSLLYRNRAFCRYVCPVGGFIGLYAMLAPVGLRVQDPGVCREHRTKDCITGNERGYGCPWMVYPGNLQRNVYCGLCMECLKTCPKDNIAIVIRQPGEDLYVAEEHRLDEAYKAFIMLGCALIYSVVLLGPWGWLKSWANLESLPHWALYAAGFLSFNLLALPGLFALFAALARRIGGMGAPLRRVVVDFAYTLVPLGLAAWIAFSLGFVLVNGSYALQTLSDPFGWGWNLFGTAAFPWQPLGANLLPALQGGVLIAGLVFTVQSAYRLVRQHIPRHGTAFRATLALSGFHLLVTLGFLWLYLG
ncbi:MAG: 4Fe-4S binding protein [Anaerolineae bacterium]